jgi:hypothetical protein
MTLQMLPIRQIGQMLSSNQWTEELPHNSVDDGGREDTTSLFQKAFLATYSLHGSLRLSQTKADAYIHFSAQIPSNHSTDVVYLPPDSAS